jgi:hypothetical protein
MAAVMVVVLTVVAAVTTAVVVTPAVVVSPAVVTVTVATAAAVRRQCGGGFADSRTTVGDQMHNANADEEGEHGC